MYVAVAVCRMLLPSIQLKETRNQLEKLDDQPVTDSCFMNQQLWTFTERMIEIDPIL